MNAFYRIAGLLLLTCAVVTPIKSLAQEGESSPAPATPGVPTPSTSTIPASGLTDQQKQGENLFLMNCPLCHIYSAQKKRLAIPTPQLKNLFTRPNSDTIVRTLILRGIPGRMPGFQYDLNEKEIDSLIAYLKTL